MKKFILIAVFTVSGLVFVSCSADADELENEKGSQIELVSLKQNEGLFAKEGDTINIDPNLQEGPGDDPIIVPPPPRP